jgi:hypothetical protein
MSREPEMLQRMNALVKCSLRATDGPIGRVTDTYFDDERWTVRYLVVDTGMWLGWHVLIAPQSIAHLDWERETIDVGLTRDQVERSPRADLQHPLSRLYETEFYTHFGYPPYWDAPPTPAVDSATAVGHMPIESAADSHVRSWREVKGYHIHAIDGEIGHVDDLFVDPAAWLIRFIEVDTSNWIGGTSVLVPRPALREVSWPDSLIHVSLTRAQVHNSPRSDEAHLTGAFEENLQKYYGGPR